jgi:hypothetical protein
VTVEKILTLLDAPLNFEREDFPIPRDLYPFAVELEPLSPSMYLRKCLQKVSSGNSA